MTVHMETTTIPVKRTVTEIHDYIANYGAKTVVIDYDDDGMPTSLKFFLLFEGKPIPYQLPARISPVFHYLNKKRPLKNREKYKARDYDQASKVAWRQVYRWVQAQFALIGLGMVESHEVFLPYMTSNDGGTLYKSFKAKAFKGLLPENTEDQSDTFSKPNVMHLPSASGEK